jgi:hypothetical protein
VSRLCRLRGAGRPRSRQPSNSASPTSASPTAAERPLPGRPPPRPTARRGFFPTPALRENGAVVGPEEAPSRAARRTAPPGHTTPQSGRRRAPARRRRSDSATARRAGRRSPGRRRSVEPLPGASCAITTRAARRRLPGAVLLPSSSHPLARAWPVEGSRCSTTCSCGHKASVLPNPLSPTLVAASGRLSAYIVIETVAVCDRRRPDARSRAHSWPRRGSRHAARRGAPDSRRVA